MKKYLNKKNFILLLLLIVLMLNFSFHIFVSPTESFSGKTYDNFQKDSELLVLHKIYQDKHYSKTLYGLGTIVDDNNKTINLPSFKNELNSEDNHSFESYTSQYGLQGHIFSFLKINFNIPFKLLNILCSSLLAIVLFFICYIISNKYSKLLGIIFYLTFLLSPWVIAFANNLYWVEFTWFLPTLFALMLSQNYSKKRIYVPLIFASILIKCLCGYEYITSIMLMTISFFIVDLFTCKKEQRKQIFITILIVGVSCLAAFILALLIHANLRGNGNILEGIKQIYENDIVRRTLNLPGSDKFDQTVFGNSIKASIFDTINKYFVWNTNIIFGISGEFFKLLIFSSFIFAIYDVIEKSKTSKRNLAMYVIFLITTLSWYVLGKSHSYIHVHLNYVLWYFGFVQICLYIVFKQICKIMKYIFNHDIDKL